MLLHLQTYFEGSMWHLSKRLRARARV